MGYRIKKIWNGVNSILIALVAVLVIALVGVRFLGLDLYVVLSGSMEPTYQTGSVIYVKDVDTSELEIGDAITYSLDGEIVATHRIIEKFMDNGTVSFQTKGDANEIEDGVPVSEDMVIGKPVFTIPKLGYLVTYMQTASGRYATIAVGALLLLMLFLPDLIFDDDNDKEEKEQPE